MAYTELIPISLGSSQTGLTLRAVLREPDSGSMVNFDDGASYKNTGFVERGNGEYSFYSELFPDDFQGMVEIELDGDQSYKASATVRPPTVDLNADQTGVTIGTVTNNTDMRGTDNAALASVATDARLAELDAANLPADIDAIKAKTDNLPTGVRKNAALAGFEFLMVDSADGRTPKTGLTVTGQVSIDTGALQALTNSVSEIGSGIYAVDLAAGDLNGDVITLRFTASGADPTLVTIKTNA